MLKNSAFPNIYFSPLLLFVKYNLLVNLVFLVNVKVLLWVSFLLDWGGKKSPALAFELGCNFLHKSHLLQCR